MRLSVFLGALVLAAGCSDATSPTLAGETFDVTYARAAWLANQPVNYAYEFTMTTEWGSPSPYTRDNTGQFYQVTVKNGAAVEVRDPSGKVLQDAVPRTIEEQWQVILAAQKDGSLKMAVFTKTGIPVEWFIDHDNWADDAIRTFVRSLTPM